MLEVPGFGNSFKSLLTSSEENKIMNANAAAVSGTDKRILPAFLLCFFLGTFGAHRFYVGKIGTAIAQIFTLGGLGLWAFIDLIMIIVGAFKDKEGNKITQWT
jgi:TM2 domain-containing membrane protein YozV